MCDMCGEGEDEDERVWVEVSIEPLLHATRKEQERGLLYCRDVRYNRVQ